MNKRTLLLIIVVNVALLAQDAQKILERVESAFNKTDVLEIEFEEQYVWKLTGEANTIAGNLIMKGEDQFRIETDDQIIVSDGETLWTYSKPTQRVLVDKLSETSELLLPRRILLHYIQNYQSKMLGDETLEGKSCRVVQFTDPAEEQFYTKIILWIDDSKWLPVRLDQEDGSGNKNIFLLKSIKDADNHTSRLFKFEIPPGTDIIQM